MRTMTPALTALFQSADRRIYEQELYTLTLPSGLDVLRYTSALAPVTWLGNTYLPGPLFEKPRIKLRAGLVVDNFNTVFTPRATDLVLGRPMAQVIKDGVFAGCDIEILRAYSKDPGDPIVGVITVFAGLWGEADFEGPNVNLSILSHSILLDNPAPEDTYQTNCRNKLFDSHCKVNAAAWTDTLTVINTPLRSTFDVSGSARTAGVYNRGSVLFLTGNCSGIQRSVKSWTPSTMILANPLPRPPSAGSVIVAKAGCDKNLNGDCSASKFNNQVNFRGEPFTPVAETAV